MCRGPLPLPRIFLDEARSDTVAFAWTHSKQCRPGARRTRFDPVKPTMFRSVIVTASVLWTVAVSLSTAAGAVTVTRETMERRFLDSCVYAQFQVKDVDRLRMIEKCRCATKQAMSTIEGDEVDVPPKGLTGPQTVAIRTGIAACFKP